MKYFLLAIAILIVGLTMAAEKRYELVVNSPVVARMDRLTGDVWIVNGGMWRKVDAEVEEKEAPVTPEPAQAAPVAKK